jgi:hypothetical protein
MPIFKEPRVTSPILFQETIILEAACSFLHNWRQRYLKTIYGYFTNQETSFIQAALQASTLDEYPNVPPKTLQVHWKDLSPIGCFKSAITRH